MSPDQESAQLMSAPTVGRCEAVQVFLFDHIEELRPFLERYDRWLTATEPGPRPTIPDDLTLGFVGVAREALRAWDLLDGPDDEVGSMP